MDNAERCRVWTRITLTLLFVQMGLVTLTCTLLVGGSEEGTVMIALAACWTAAILLHIANFRLTLTGFQADRYEYTLSLLNHSDLRLRLLFHMLINWLVILLTASIAWLVEQQTSARGLAWLVISTSLVVWISFNLQHRKINRSRNIQLTTMIAAILISMVLPLLYYR